MRDRLEINENMFTSLRASLLPDYVFQKLQPLFELAEQRGLSLIDFGMGNPDGTPAPHIVAALCQSAAQNHTHGYSPAVGHEALLHALAVRYSKDFGAQLTSSSDIVMTLGSKAGIAHFAQTMVSPGDGVLVPAPCYPIHRYAFDLAGGNVLPVALGEESSDMVDRYTHAIESAAKPPVGMVLNFPHNPTTRTASLNELVAFIALAEKHDMWILHDFAYGTLGFDDYRPISMLSLPGAKDRVVETYSLSKSYNMAGWRVGFLAGNPEIISYIKKLQSYVEYGHFEPVQQAAIAALLGPQKCVEHQRRIYQSRRDELVAGLSALDWPVPKPKATMFLWAPIPPFAQGHLTDSQFVEQLIPASGIIVSPGSGFGPEGNGHVRFALRQPHHQVQEALARLDALFHGPEHGILTNQTSSGRRSVG